MKKITIILLVICCQQKNFAQFFRGFGVYGALTQSAHKYRNYDREKQDTTLNINHYYPQDHISKEHFNWGAGIFAEFLRNDGVRWQTEFEYANKGANEREVTNPFTGERGGVQTNKYTYIQWNNYLKFFGLFGLPRNIYLMPGVRLEYLFRKSTPVFSSYSSNLPRIWYSGNVGLGYQFPIFKNFWGVVEYHYNPDLYNLKVKDNVRIRNRTLEARIGIMWRPKRRSIDDCNTPRYKGPSH